MNAIRPLLLPTKNSKPKLTSCLPVEMQKNSKMLLMPFKGTILKKNMTSSSLPLEKAAWVSASQRPAFSS